MTEEQENCKYCHFPSIAIDEKLNVRVAHNSYHNWIHGNADGKTFSFDIEYCPKCGRKLANKEEAE
ncbi:hypothetical protein [Fructilactobacillus florum]|uniref:hypothetical protein n=1 Tax=Fructilactobacillus florum TaxID=640331 RepID=UPI0006D0B674|nr:hypothetical protein [Fructilactobacillus florum]